MSSNVRRVGLREARHNLAELLLRTRYKGESFIISKHGEPLAIVIPISRIPTVQPADPHAPVLTAAQKKFGALAKMIPAELKK